ncbi:MAG: tyrosine-protein phosphatase [Dehalococcoidia bacterium]|nr:tyrosine-protein phosphatase [Dehalococcoidia bacterium]
MLEIFKTIGLAVGAILVVVAGSLGGLRLVESGAQANNTTSALFQTLVDKGAVSSVVGIISRAVTPALNPPVEFASSIKAVPNSPQAPVAVWKSSPMSGPVKGTPLANFGVVEEGAIYRAAQPTDSEYRWLLDQGYKSTVNLRRETGDNRDALVKLGFQNQLWLDIEDETAPNDAQAEQFLNFITDSANWPVLIHCKVGLGRTGTMAAVIRYSIDGLSMEDALKEARMYRGGISLVKVQEDWLNRWATNHRPGSYRPVNQDTSALPQLLPFAPAG